MRKDKNEDVEFSCDKEVRRGLDKFSGRCMGMTQPELRLPPPSRFGLGFPELNTITVIKQPTFDIMLCGLGFNLS